MASMRQTTSLKCTSRHCFLKVSFFFCFFLSLLTTTFLTWDFVSHTIKIKGFECNLGNKLITINVGLPHPTLIWSQPGLELATQQRSFAYEAETMLTMPLNFNLDSRFKTFPSYVRVCVCVCVGLG